MERQEADRIVKQWLSYVGGGMTVVTGAVALGLTVHTQFVAPAMREVSRREWRHDISDLLRRHEAMPHNGVSERELDAVERRIDDLHKHMDQRFNDLEEKVTDR